MYKIPCEDCLVLPMCMGKYVVEYMGSRVVPIGKLRKNCILLDEWLLEFKSKGSPVSSGKNIVKIFKCEGSKMKIWISIEPAIIIAVIIAVIKLLS